MYSWRVKSQRDLLKGFLARVADNVTLQLGVGGEFLGADGAAVYLCIQAK